MLKLKETDESSVRVLVSDDGALTVSVDNASTIEDLRSALVSHPKLACTIMVNGDMPATWRPDVVRQIVEQAGGELMALHVNRDVAVRESEAYWGCPVHVAPVNDDPNRTHTVHRTLRSGSHLRFAGNVVVMGDINPGATIEATGNVIVFGAVKGTIHAGASGDEKAFVLGLRLHPRQVRIGRKIAITPHSHHDNTQPHLARVAHDQIVFEPYRKNAVRF